MEENTEVTAPEVSDADWTGYRMPEPFDDYMVLQAIPPQPTTIVLPNGNSMEWFKVKRMGPGKWNEDHTARLSMNCQVGDIVLLYPNGMSIMDSMASLQREILARDTDIVGRLVPDRAREKPSGILVTDSSDVIRKALANAEQGKNGKNGRHR